MSLDLQTAFLRSISLLEKMIAIPSVSREEKAVSDMLQEYMESTGREVHRSGNNLWLLDPCYDSARPTLLLNAHVDTVKPVSTWHRDPFCASREEVVLPDGSVEERIYGLGANDDGASLVTLLHVFLMLTGEGQSGNRNYNLVFLASAEEEVGGKNGIESVLPQLPKIDVGLVGEPTGMQPAIAEKGLVVIDGIAHGKSGHAARNEGVNALYLALEAIDRLRNFHFERESAMLGPVKVTVTGIQAGTAHNVVPDTCSFVVDCRTTDAYSNDEVVEILRREVSKVKSPLASEKPAVELIPRSTRLQPSGIPADHPLLKCILALGRQPFGSPTLSDQALMRFPSLKMGPGQSSRSHTADEYIRTDEIREALQLYYKILTQFYFINC
jgi:acetylornithine deacetylase